MKEHLLAQTKHEYSPRQRAALLVVAGAVFLVILPWVLVRLGGRVDRALDLPALRRGVPGLSPPRAVHHSQAAAEGLMSWRHSIRSR